MKNRRISFKELFRRIFDQYNEGKTTTSINLGITNKALKRSLDLIITDKGIFSDSVEYDSDWNITKTSRPLILEFGRLILGHRTPSKRKKYAKRAEDATSIPFTKLIPMEGYSNLFKDAPQDPFRSIDPSIKREYEEHYEEIGMPPIKIIPKDGGEPYYLFYDPKDLSKFTREWKGSSK